VHLEPVLPQTLGDCRRGAVLLVGQLGVLMQEAVELLVFGPDVLQAGQHGRCGR
jgi:hypothetical protein